MTEKNYEQKIAIEGENDDKTMVTIESFKDNGLFHIILKSPRMMTPFAFCLNETEIKSLICHFRKYVDLKMVELQELDNFKEK